MVHVKLPNVGGTNDNQENEQYDNQRKVIAVSVSITHHRSPPFIYLMYFTCYLKYWYGQTFY